MNILDTATRKIVSDPVKRHAWVKYQIQMQGRSMADLAASHGYDRRTLYQVFAKPYPRMEKLVAEAIGLTPQVLFPERYDSDGLPNRRMGRPRKPTVKHIRRGGKRNSSSAPAE